MVKMVAAPSSWILEKGNTGHQLCVRSHFTGGLFVAMTHTGVLCLPFPGHTRGMGDTPWVSPASRSAIPQAVGQEC